MFRGIFYSIIVFILACAPRSLKAQVTDSLLHDLEHIQTIQDDSVRLAYLRKRMDLYWDNSDYEASLMLAEEGEKLAKKMGWLDAQIDYHFWGALLLDYLGRNDESLSRFKEGLTLAETHQRLPRAGDFAQNIGYIWQQRLHYGKALEAYLLAAVHYKNANKNEMRAKVLNNIAVIYKKEGRLEEARDIYIESIRIKSEIGDTLGLIAGYQNLGLLYVHRQQPDSAILLLELALSLYPNSASATEKAQTQVALADALLRVNRPIESLRLLEAGLPFISSSDSVAALLLRGEGLSMGGNQSAAIPFLLHGIDMAESRGQWRNLRSGHKLLAVAYEKTGQFDLSSKAWRSYADIQDTLYQHQKLELMQEMQVRFDVDRKQQELNISQLQLKARTSQRNWSYLAGALLLLAAGGYIITLVQRIRHNRRLARAREILQQQKVREMEQEQEIHLVNAMIEGQEKERGRIAQDLHDSLGGLLATVKSHFSSLEIVSPNHQPIYSKTGELIDMAHAEVRRIAHNMMPLTLRLTDFKGALEDLAQSIRLAGCKCDLEIMRHEDPPLPIKVTLFRILQELTQNTFKHAQASHVLIQLFQDEQQLHLVYEDDGIGFIMDNLSDEGLGLSGIRNRVAYLKGELDIHSEPQKGSTFSIHIPIHQNAAELTSMKS